MVASGRRLPATIALIGALALPWPEAGRGQDAIRFHGRVQWISGTQMVVAADDGESIAVDLLRIDQSSYQYLSQGDGVSVAGTITPDQSRVIAQDVRSDPAPDTFDQGF